MLDSLCADQPVGQPLHLFGRTAKYDHLQATLVVEMRVQSGNNDFVILVLDVGQLLGQQTSVMVVDEGDRAYYQSVGRDHYRGD